MDEGGGCAGSGRIAPGNGGDGLAAFVKKAPQSLPKPSGTGDSNWGKSDALHFSLTLASHASPADLMTGQSKRA